MGSLALIRKKDAGRISVRCVATGTLSDSILSTRALKMQC